MLHIDHLSVRYGGTPAVHDVSLEVRSNEIVGLLGPNGAGKTTTLRAIMGLVAAEARSLVFAGSSLSGLSTEQIVRRGLALVPEGRHVFSSLTVAENLLLAGSANRDRERHEAQLDMIYALFPVLRKCRARKAGTLSGGEQQQLALARGLAASPRLLLLDEPSLGLAPRLIDSVFETLSHVRQTGTTILLVEQNAAQTLELADRVYLMRSGRVAASGTAAELTGTIDLAQAYFGLPGVSP